MYCARLGEGDKALAAFDVFFRKALTDTLCALVGKTQEVDANLGYGGGRLKLPPLRWRHSMWSRQARPLPGRLGGTPRPTGETARLPIQTMAEPMREAARRRFP